MCANIKFTAVITGMLILATVNGKDHNICSLTLKTKQNKQTPPFNLYFYLYHSQDFILPVPQKQSTFQLSLDFINSIYHMHFGCLILLLTSYISWMDKIVIKCYSYLFLIGFSYLQFVPSVSLHLLYTIN